MTRIPDLPQDASPTATDFLITYDIETDTTKKLGVGDFKTYITAPLVNTPVSISANTTAVTTLPSNYFYFVSGTTTLTMPTAVSNYRRYTVKNTGTATVTINTTGAETIDGSSTVTLVANQAVDLISDTTNWRVI